MPPRKPPIVVAMRYERVVPTVTGMPSAYSAAPLASMPMVTAGVDVVAGLVGDEDAGEDRQAPAEVDEQPAAAVALGLAQHDVGDDATAQQGQHRRAGDLVQENSCHMSSSMSGSATLRNRRASVARRLWP